MEKGTSHMELITRYFPRLSGRQLKQLDALEGLYTDWNSRINVISRKDLDGLYEKHVLHSLGIAAAFDFEKDSHVLDIGTGGGFPGIPLAILFPQTTFHLVDSIGKKIKVAKAVAASIGLTNLTATQTRAENMIPQKFDVVVSRATAPLKQLWIWSNPLLNKNKVDRSITKMGDREDSRPKAGGLICLKGGDLAEEIAASGRHPHIIELRRFFLEEYFHEKFILQIYS